MTFQCTFNDVIVSNLFYKIFPKFTPTPRDENPFAPPLASNFDPPDLKKYPTMHIMGPILRPLFRDWRRIDTKPDYLPECTYDDVTPGDRHFNRFNIWGSDSRFRVLGLSPDFIEPNDIDPYEVRNCTFVDDSGYYAIEALPGSLGIVDTVNECYVRRVCIPMSIVYWYMETYNPISFPYLGYSPPLNDRDVIFSRF